MCPLLPQSSSKCLWHSPFCCNWKALLRADGGFWRHVVGSMPLHFIGQSLEEAVQENPTQLLLLASLRVRKGLESRKVTPSWTTQVLWVCVIKVSSQISFPSCVNSTSTFKEQLRTERRTVQQLVWPLKSVVPSGGLFQPWAPAHTDHPGEADSVHLSLLPLLP